MAFSRWLYLILTITIKHLQQQIILLQTSRISTAKLPENEGTVQKMSGQRPVYVELIWHFRLTLYKPVLPQSTTSGAAVQQVPATVGNSNSIT